MKLVKERIKKLTFSSNGQKMLNNMFANYLKNMKEHEEAEKKKSEVATDEFRLDVDEEKSEHFSDDEEEEEAEDEEVEELEEIDKNEGNKLMRMISTNSLPDDDEL